MPDFETSPLDLSLLKVGQPRQVHHLHLSNSNFSNYGFFVFRNFSFFPGSRTVPLARIWNLVPNCSRQTEIGKKPSRQIDHHGLESGR